MICFADNGHKVDEMTTRGASGANFAPVRSSVGDQTRQVTTTDVSFTEGKLMFPGFKEKFGKEVA